MLKSISKGLKAEFARILQNIRVHSAALSEIASAENMLNIDNMVASLTILAKVKIYLQRTRVSVESILRAVAQGCGSILAMAMQGLWTLFWRWHCKAV